MLCVFVKQNYRELDVTKYMFMVKYGVVSYYTTIVKLLLRSAPALTMSCRTTAGPILVLEIDGLLASRLDEGLPIRGETKFLAVPTGVFGRFRVSFDVPHIPAPSGTMQNCFRLAYA